MIKKVTNSLNHWQIKCWKHRQQEENSIFFHRMHFFFSQSQTAEFIIQNSAEDTHMHTIKRRIKKHIFELFNRISWQQNQKQFSLLIEEWKEKQQQQTKLKYFLLINSKSNTVFYILFHWNTIQQQQQKLYLINWIYW